MKSDSLSTETILSAFLHNATNHTTDIILQACPKQVVVHDFYDVLSFKEESLHDVSTSGFTTVWLPPPCKSVQVHGYLPGCLYDLDSFYGTKQSLIKVINVLKERKLQVMLDIPLKRRCLKEHDPSARHNMFVTRPIWTIDTLSRQRNNSFRKLLLRSFNHGLDINQSIPIDLRHSKVQEDLLQWIDWLHEQLNMDTLVCDGVGFDDIPFLLALMTKVRGRHDTMMIEQSPALNETIQQTLPPVEEEEEDRPTITQQETNISMKQQASMLGVAICCVEWNTSHDGALEYDQSLAAKQLFDFAQATMNAFLVVDMVTRASLEQAVLRHEYWRLIYPGARLPGLLGWKSEQAITVLDWNDLLANEERMDASGYIVCRTDYHYFPEQHVMKGYAYLLTHPGIPCIHWDHYYDSRWREAIDALIQIRVALSIHASSQVYIESASKDYYAAFVDSVVAMKIGSGHWHPTGPQWKLATCGWEYAVWTRTIC
eukprot:jgi/Galph1/3513/GphlegSOOS_G2140.1